MIQINDKNISLVEIIDKILKQKNSRLFVLREDLIHPEISGNKWRKLKYNIGWAKEHNIDTVLTFGGAYSNHIAATAAAGAFYGLKTIGVIRGEETKPLNNTLNLARQNGMQLKYVSRENYRNKDQDAFISELKKEFGEVFIIPEGGSNSYAVKGCTEILSNIEIEFDVITCACGTGGTIAGIISSLQNQEAIGFPALKGAKFLEKDIARLVNDYAVQFNAPVKKKNWSLDFNYHFGGYAKIDDKLVAFVKEFRTQHQIPLDLIYTGKMMYGIFDKLKNTDQFDNKTIIAVHTGGIQGNEGFRERFNIDL